MLRTTQALDREWRASYQHAREGATALRRWAQTEPALVGLRNLGEVLEQRRDRERGGAVLAALARLAPTDVLAARTLLQAMLPGLVHLARRRFDDDADAVEEVVALAWERIRTYPPDRPGSVAANVVVDVRKRYREHREMNAVGQDRHLPSTLRSAPSAEEVSLARLTVQELVEAARSGVISGQALRLIVRTRLEGVPLRQVAAEGRENEPYLTTLRWRAERRLRRELAEVA